MTREVLLHPSVVDTLEDLPAASRERIEDALARLGEDPFTARSGADVRKLTGTQGREDLWRLRVGDWRAVYAVEGDEVLVTDLFRRGEGYDLR